MVNWTAKQYLEKTQSKRQGHLHHKSLKNTRQAKQQGHLNCQYWREHGASEAQGHLNCEYEALRNIWICSARRAPHCPSASISRASVKPACGYKQVGVDSALNTPSWSSAYRRVHN